MRIGILGAANIAATSLVKPARNVRDVTIDAIAARDAGKAREYALRHGVPVSYGGYEALLADASIDAVYIPLPNAFHGEWTKRALAAGKHVLCEKPFTANSDEAREVAAVAAGSPELVVMEAFHYRYHPLTRHLVDIIGSGELGALESVDATLCIPMPHSKGNIRWHYGLAGGSQMDLGCYAVHMVRTAAGVEPEVVDAEARTTRKDPLIDRWLRTSLRFPGLATGDDAPATGGAGLSGGTFAGSTTVAMWSKNLLSLRLDVRGSRGRLRANRLISPQFFGSIVVHTDAGRRLERATRRPSYEFQLEAFRDAVTDTAAGRTASTNLTPPSDSVATMTVIDAAYRAAGLPIRVPVPVGG